MRVVEALSEHSMEFVEPFLTPVVKLINTIAREHIRPFMEERVQPMRLLHGDTKNPERNTQPEVSRDGR